MRENNFKSKQIIAFQGAPGAYSDMAFPEVFPEIETPPCKTFTDTFIALTKGLASLAMIPIENSVAGRVADIHQLLPESKRLFCLFVGQQGCNCMGEEELFD